MKNRLRVFIKIFAQKMLRDSLLNHQIASKCVEKMEKKKHKK